MLSGLLHLKFLPKVFLLGLSIGLLGLTGCGQSYPEVSGRVTVDGQPVSDMSVIFAPVSVRETPFPGPIAQAVTDADGRFSLVTRDGDAGGTPGLNRVEFYSSGAFELDYLQSDAARLLALSGGDKTHPSYQERQKLVAKIKTLKAMSKAMSQGGKLKPGATTEFSVPDGGTDSADFELTQLVNKP